MQTFLHVKLNFSLIHARRVIFEGTFFLLIWSKFTIKDDNKLIKEFDFVSFRHSGKELEEVDYMVRHLTVEKIAIYWIWFFGGVAILYIIMTSAIMYKVADLLTEPITDLTDIIQNAIKNVRAQKSKKQTKDTRMTMKFVEGFKTTNEEMNVLFYSFTQMAKKIMICQQ